MGEYLLNLFVFTNLKMMKFVTFCLLVVSLTLCNGQNKTPSPTKELTKRDREYLRKERRRKKNASACTDVNKKDEGERMKACRHLSRNKGWCTYDREEKKCEAAKTKKKPLCKDFFNAKKVRKSEVVANSNYMGSTEDNLCDCIDFCWQHNKVDRQTLDAIQMKRGICYCHNRKMKRKSIAVKRESDRKKNQNMVLWVRDFEN